MAEPLPPALHDEIARMKAEADALLASPALVGIVVVPDARYRIHDTAA